MWKKRGGNEKNYMHCIQRVEVRMIQIESRSEFPVFHKNFIQFLFDDENSVHCEKWKIKIEVS